jgi:hypothetical protein
VRICSLILFFTAVSASISAQKNSIRTFDSIAWSLKITELRSSFSQNKKDIPPHIELPILIALSYYPELADTKIKFKECKIKTTMNARPTFVSILFRKKRNYRFVVRVNSTKNDSIIQTKAIPFNAKVGVFGHEFFHFVDYQRKGSFHLTKRLFAYGNKAKKEAFEKEIDLGTIKRGLGWQLYDWSNYVLNESNATMEYKDFKRQIYLEPEEIKKTILELEYNENNE